MLRPPLRASSLGGVVLGGGNTGIVVISLTRYSGYVIDYPAWIIRRLISLNYIGTKIDLFLIS